MWLWKIVHKITVKNKRNLKIELVGKSMSVVKTFMEACIDAIALDGREGISLKVLSWKKVEKALKNNHNFEVDLKQMRNHFDYMKTKYGAWLSLKNRTGNIYDESTNTFNLTYEEWDLEILVSYLLFNVFASFNFFI